MTLLYATISLIISIGCYSISQLAQHKKLRWMSKDPLGFWGEDMDKRKYDYANGGRLPSKNNWYTRIFRIPFKERWITSTNFTSFATDGYHLMQSIFLASLSLSVALLTNIHYLIVWPSIVLVHA